MLEKEVRVPDRNAAQRIGKGRLAVLVFFALLVAAGMLFPLLKANNNLPHPPAEPPAKIVTEDNQFIRRLFHGRLREGVGCASDGRAPLKVTGQSKPKWRLNVKLGARAG